MFTYTSTVSFFATSSSWTREETGSTSSINRTDATFTDGGHFHLVNSNNGVTAKSTTQVANESETRYTQISYTFQEGFGTDDFSRGPSVNYDTAYGSLGESFFEWLTTNNSGSTVSKSSWVEGNQLNSTGGPETRTTTYSNSESFATTRTHFQTSTRTSSSAETYRVTRTTSSTRLSSSINAGNTIIYNPSTTNYTTTTSTQGVTQDGRFFTYFTQETSTIQQFLERTVALADAAYYSSTFLVGTHTHVFTKGNEVLYVVTTTLTGLRDLSELAVTATSTDFGAWSVFPISTENFGTSTFTTTGVSLITPLSPPTTKTYTGFKFTNSFTFHSILPTASSDSFTYHSTRIHSVTLTQTSSSLLSTSGTSTSLAVGYYSSVVDLGASTYTYSTSGSTFSYSLPIRTTYYTSYSNTVSYSFYSATATSTYTTTQVVGSATTTSTSARSYAFLPFQTDSTTTSRTGTIETFTKSTLSRRTATTSTLYEAEIQAGWIYGCATNTNTTVAFLTSVTTTIEFPGSYHKESSTMTVITTIASWVELVSQGGRAIWGAGVPLENIRETLILTIPGPVTTASSFSKSSSFTVPGEYAEIHFSGMMTGYTHETMTGNGIILRTDAIYSGSFAAAAGQAFNVHPCMAIGFRPATNDVHSAPIYFNPSFSVGTLSSFVWSRFTTTSTSGTATINTTSSSTISAIRTDSTIPFTKITLHQGVSASIFVSFNQTESYTSNRSYSSSWGSYTSFNTTTTRTTTTSTDPSTISTTNATIVTREPPFVAIETTVSLFSQNTIFITQRSPAVFLTNDGGGNRYVSFDQRFTDNPILDIKTKTITISFGGSVSASTHLRNERGNDAQIPIAFGGYHPVSTTTGFAILALDSMTFYQTTKTNILGYAYKMTIGPRGGGATSTTSTTMTLYTASINNVSGKNEITITNDLSNMGVLEPLTMFSVVSDVNTPFNLCPFFTSSDYLILNSTAATYFVT